MQQIMSPSASPDEVQLELDQIVLRSLAKDPEDRS